MDGSNSEGGFLGSLWPLVFSLGSPGTFLGHSWLSNSLSLLLSCCCCCLGDSKPRGGFQQSTPLLWPQIVSFCARFKEFWPPCFNKKITNIRGTYNPKIFCIVLEGSNSGCGFLASLWPLLSSLGTPCYSWVRTGYPILKLGFVVVVVLVVVSGAFQSHGWI